MPLDLHERLFPAAGQLHVCHAHFFDGFIDGQPLVGRHESLSRTLDVLPLEEGCDDGRTGRRSADAQFLHRLARLLVRQFLAAALHGREQGGFRVERLGHGLFLCKTVPRYGNGFRPVESGRAFVFRLFVLLLVFRAVEYGSPARFDHGNGMGTECQPVHRGLDDQRLFPALGRECFEHTPGNHPVNGLFLPVKGFRDRMHTGDDQRVVVGHFPRVDAAGG